jgi:hypothetical protein
VQWFGEAVVGLLPLIAHEAIQKAAKLPVVPAVCDSGMTHCRAASETPVAEICIVAVVMSGLALLSLVRFGPHRRKAPPTMLTFIVGLGALIALIFGLIFYALVTTGINQEIVSLTDYTLASALLTSLFLTLEGAILDA